METLYRALADNRRPHHRHPAAQRPDHLRQARLRPARRHRSPTAVPVRRRRLRKPLPGHRLAKPLARSAAAAQPGAASDGLSRPTTSPLDATAKRPPRSASGHDSTDTRSTTAAASRRPSSRPTRQRAEPLRGDGYLSCSSPRAGPPCRDGQRQADAPSQSPSQFHSVQAVPERCARCCEQASRRAGNPSGRSIVDLVSGRSSVRVRRPASGPTARTVRRTYRGSPRGACG